MTRVLIEKYPGGPTVNIPVACADETETCCLCGQPAPDTLVLSCRDEERPLCRRCFWRYPYDTTERVPPGMEQDGTGI